MEFQNEFDVKAPIDTVYETMLDLERVAPAMPGAQVLEKTDDDHYKVAIKVKVGPISMQYRGDVEVAEKDPEAHRAILKVQAREARGQGTANADVELSLDERGDATHGQMKTNVQLAGKAAAMGGGVIKDVSAKLVDQFARNLGQMLAGEPEPEPAAEPAAAAATPPSNDGAAAGDGTPAAAPSGAAQQPAGAAAGAAGTGPRPTTGFQPEADEDEGLDVLGIAASITADKLKNPRVLLGSVGIVLLLGWLLRRGGRN